MEPFWSDALSVGEYLLMDKQHRLMVEMPTGIHDTHKKYMTACGRVVSVQSKSQNYRPHCKVCQKSEGA